MLQARGLEKLAECLQTLEVDASIGQGLMEYGLSLIHILFEQNMFAVRAEIEVGFRCDTSVFNKLTGKAKTGS